MAARSLGLLSLKLSVSPDTCSTWIDMQAPTLTDRPGKTGATQPHTHPPSHNHLHHNLTKYFHPQLLTLLVWRNVKALAALSSARGLDLNTGVCGHPSSRPPRYFHLSLSPIADRELSTGVEVTEDSPRYSHLYTICKFKVQGSRFRTRNCQYVRRENPEGTEASRHVG
jgi:hypothetical protein